VDQGNGACWADVPLGTDGVITTDCGCTTPTPDPASACGFVGCVGAGAHAGRDGEPWAVCVGGPACPPSHPDDPGCHSHQPTRCLTCGHPIEEARP
jgi:hypothetical protein